MYEDMTDDFLRERMLSRVPDKLDKRPSALIYDTVGAAAVELAILYVEIEYLIKNSYGDTAAREYLALLCRDRGITPEKATKAVLRGKFAPDSAVAAGQRFNIGEINYVLTGKKIEDEEGGWEVQCETAGEAGNQYLGKMIPIDYIQGLKTAELTEILIPGRAEEDTEALRQRYFDSFDVRSFAGNRAAYIETVRKIDGVGGVKVARVWNGGIRPADMIPDTKVDEWYSSVIGGLEGEAAGWLSAVYTAARDRKLTVGGTVLITVVNSLDFGGASDALVDRIQTELDPAEDAGEGYGLAPIGHVVSVRSAEAVPVVVRTTVTFSDGYGWPNTKALIQEAVDAYLLELRKGWADGGAIVVRISRMETRILGVRGVVDVAGTEINGSESNLALDENQVPVLGGVSA